jgi:hypothetical protein
VRDVYSGGEFVIVVVRGDDGAAFRCVDSMSPQEAPRAVKIRDAKPEELAPKARKARALSPRQLAIQKRDNAIQKLLNEIAVGPMSAIKKIELEEGEKLASIRLAVGRHVKAHPASIHMGVRSGAIYLSRTKIPGGGGGRPRKNP